jgi:hypothetical protein
MDTRTPAHLRFTPSENVVYRLPRRVRLIEGESFASWLLRASVANSLSRKQLLAVVPHRQRAPVDDYDCFSDSEALRELAAISGFATEQFTSMVHGSLAGWLFPHRERTRNLCQWLLRKPTRPGWCDPRQTRYQVCPLCLGSDEFPHFRLMWRISAFSVCLQHQVVLIDQCPRCGEIINLGHTRESEFEYRLVKCAGCTSDFRQITPMPARAEVVVLERKILESRHSGSFRLCEAIRIDPLSLFVTLRYLHDLFYSSVIGPALRSTASQYIDGVRQDVAWPTHRSGSYNDAAAAEVRYNLAIVVANLLRSWPANFIDLIHRARGPRSAMICQTNPSPKIPPLLRQALLVA